MGKLAIFIDGGYASNVAKGYKLSFDYESLSAAITKSVQAVSPNTQLLRTYFHDAMPYQSNPPTVDERAVQVSSIILRDAATSPGF